MPVKHKSRPLTTGYKKQHGIHHKHTNTYLKVYWPYIPVVIFVLCGIITSVVVLGSRSVSTSSSTTNISLQSLLNSSNAARKSKSLAPFAINSALTTAAQIKANEMAIGNYYSLNSPSGETPWQIVKDTGYNYQVAGENLAYGFNSANNIVSAWENSSKNSNLLNAGFSNVGFGVAQSPNFEDQGPQTIIVAIYASPKGSATSFSSSKNSGEYTSASLSVPHSVAITRVENLTNRYSIISVFIFGAAFGIVAGYLIIRHTIVLRKWVSEGETLVIKHPYIDFLLIVILIGLASLNQTVGLIH